MPEKVKEARINFPLPLKVRERFVKRAKGDGMTARGALVAMIMGFLRSKPDVSVSDYSTPRR